MGVRAEQRDGLSPNRGCRAALHQTPPTSRAGTQQTRHQGKCVPSPTHGNTTAGENPVVLREHYFHWSNKDIVSQSFHCSNKDKEQSDAQGAGETGQNYS